MPATPFDSAHLGGLFATGETARLFSDSAEIRAMMIVEGALARVQGAHGVIPQTAAEAIHRASLELQIDPAGLAGATASNGVSTPAFVAAFREAMQAPEHAQFLHWGATSQDIQDTALMLRLRQAFAQFDAQLRALLPRLADLAREHCDTAMAARTYGQHATPTSFGAVVAMWGWPLLEALQSLPALRNGALLVSLSGAAGTASMIGPAPDAIRTDLAKALGLGDPGRSWHSDRGPVLRLADWATRLTISLGKMGEDLGILTQTGIAEVSLGATGSSSTMPQKQNPVAPSVMLACARHATGLNATLQGAGLHHMQRDGAAWFTEWLTLPQLILTTATALGHADRLSETLTPNAATMARALHGSGGAILAEALSFELAKSMPRADAQARLKALSRDAAAQGVALTQLVAQAYPDLNPRLFDPAAHLGSAADDARAFARAVGQSL